MKPEGPFIAEKVAAQHCDDLLRSTQQTFDPLAELARLGEKLPEQLERQLSGLCAGAKVRVDTGEATEIPAGLNGDKRGEPMLHSMIAVGPREVMMVASLPQRAMVGLVDLALGGSGRDTELPSGKLPMSARMMFGRLEKAVAEALAAAMGFSDRTMVKPKNAGAGADNETPFAGFKRIVLPVTVTVGEADGWELGFVFPGSAVAKLFADSGSKRAKPGPVEQATRPDPLAEPFGGIPLPIKAVLVDMPMLLSKLSRLKPGTVIPVSVARNVPLYAGEEIVALGSVGEVDDCAALQLTRIVTAKEK